MPERIQLRRTKGWRKPEGAVVVSRPSKWGNPFKVGETYPFMVWARLPYLDPDGFPYIDSSVTAVVAYRAWLRADDPDAEDAHPLLDEVAGLAGHDLACWCPLKDSDGNYVPCHADILLDLANQAP